LGAATNRYNRDLPAGDKAGYKAGVEAGRVTRISMQSQWHAAGRGAECRVFFISACPRNRVARSLFRYD
jgi:hypothetical protein